MTDAMITRRTFLKAAGLAALSFPFLGESSAREGGIPVLLYHDITDEEQGPYALSPSLFGSQMEWLFAEGYRAVPLREAERLRGRASDRIVVITFDDGYASLLDYALPLLERYRFHATVNIIGAWAGTFIDTGRGLNRAVMSWDEYRYLVSTGLVDLGCHTFDLHHPGGAPAVANRNLRTDLARFQEVLRSETGRSADVLAWPFGLYTQRAVTEARRAGFRYLLTSREGFLSPSSPLDEIPRLNIGGRLDLPSFRQYLGVAT